MPTLTRAASAHTPIATGWTNPSNAFSATGDNSYATALNGSTTKNISHSGDFGFANVTSGDIPDGATINEVRIRCEANLSAVVTGGVFGVQGQVSGVNFGSETTKTTTAEEEVVTVMPGVTLTHLRSASSVLKARCRGTKGNSSSALTVNLDYVRLEVDYTVGNQFAETLSTTITATTSVNDSQGLVESLATTITATTTADDNVVAYDPVVTSIIQSGTDVILDWSASPTPGVTDYLVFRRSPQTGDPFDPNTDTPLVTGITDTIFTDINPSPADYDYQVFGRVSG